MTDVSWYLLGDTLYQLLRGYFQFKKITLQILLEGDWEHIGVSVEKAVVMGINHKC